MTALIGTILATMVWLTGPAALLPQQPVSKASTLTIDATIQAIDRSNRAITLRDEMGNEDTFTVGPEVQRFDELMVGQKVRITYYESVVLQLVKPGEKASGDSFEAALNRAKSALPAGTLATQDKRTVVVKSVNPSVPSITVATDDGRVVTRKVQDPANLANVKPGDRIEITFTRALVTSVQEGR